MATSNNKCSSVALIVHIWPYNGAAVFETKQHINAVANLGGF